jgi:hypothetical protein
MPGAGGRYLYLRGPSSTAQSSPLWVPIYLSLLRLGVGLGAYLVYARLERTWPFGPAVRD